MRDLVIKLKRENECVKVRNAFLETEYSRLTELNTRLRADLAESDVSRIQLLRDCHVLKSKLDNSGL